MRGPASDAARLRALKRYVWKGRHRFLATCALGVEDLLEQEVRELPEVAEVASGIGGVAFTAPFDTVYAALLRLRLAESLRIGVVDEASAATFPMLHDQLGRVRWRLWLPARFDGRIRVKTAKSRLRDREALERTLRRVLRSQGIDAAADGAAPLMLHFHVSRDRASVRLDVGGALHRRHGNKWVSRTTIRETTAAALCRFAGTGAHDLILDPFCGSGTLIVEALELEAGAAAGRQRHVPFEASPAWKRERFAHARRTYAAPASAEDATRYLASDADHEAVRASQRNFVALGISERIGLELHRAQDLDLSAIARHHAARRPLLLSNPPFGKRAQALGAAPDALLRSVLGRATGWAFALVYPSPDELAGLGPIRVRVDRVREVVTGGLRHAMIVGEVEGDA